MRKRKLYNSYPGKKRNLKNQPLSFSDENIEWLKFTPQKRLKESTKLWQFYLSLGGNLDPEPDPQSPFYFEPI